MDSDPLLAALSQLPKPPLAAPLRRAVLDAAFAAHPGSASRWHWAFYSLLVPTAMAATTVVYLFLTVQAASRLY